MGWLIVAIGLHPAQVNAQMGALGEPLVTQPTELIPGMSSKYRMMHSTEKPVFIPMMFQLGETASLESEHDAFLQAYIHRQQQMQRNKYILLGWGATNVVTGLALLGTEYRDFGVMNASWGAINSGIALFALRDARTTSGTDRTYGQILREEQQFNRIVALNTGLDVGYMIAGIAMMQEGRSRMIRQYGTSVLIQGAFLFVYDLFLMIESTRYLNRITVEPFVAGVSLRVPI